MPRVATDHTRIASRQLTDHVRVRGSVTLGRKWLQEGLEKA